MPLTAVHGCRSVELVESSVLRFKGSNIIPKRIPLATGSGAYLVSSIQVFLSVRRLEMMPIAVKSTSCSGAVVTIITPITICGGIRGTYAEAWAGVSKIQISSSKLMRSRMTGR